MALDFPSGPGLVNGQLYTSGFSTWMWDGVKWQASYPSGGVYVPVFGGLQYPMYGFLYNRTTGDPIMSTTYAGLGAHRLRFAVSPGDDYFSGFIDYREFASNALSIVGAGPAAGNRTIFMYDNVAIAGTITVGSTTIIQGGASVTGIVHSTGPNAQISWDDRTSPSITWTWYSQNGVTRLNQGGDRLWLDQAGNLFNQGSHVIGGNVLNFAGAALGLAGPRIGGDTTNMFTQLGVNNGGWYWYGNAGNQPMSLSAAGDLVTSGIISAGTDIYFHDRSGTPIWAWYSSGNKARLYNSGGGDLFTVDGVTGNAAISSNIIQGGTYHYFQNGAGVVNGTGGPLIYADLNNFVVKSGTENGSFIFQDYAGVQRFAISNLGYLALNGKLVAWADPGSIVLYDAAGKRSTYFQVGINYYRNNTQQFETADGLLFQMQLTPAGDAAFARDISVARDIAAGRNLTLPDTGTVFSGAIKLNNPGDFGASTNFASFTSKVWHFQTTFSDDTAAGTIGFRTYDANGLAIVGAGYSPNRQVTIWDNVTVQYNLGVSGNLSLGGILTSTAPPIFNVPALPAAIYSYQYGLRLHTTTSNQDVIEFVWMRRATGTDWTTADFVIKRNVDSTDNQTAIVFGGGSTFQVRTGFTWRLSIDATNYGFQLPAGNGQYLWYTGFGTELMHLDNGGNLLVQNTIRSTTYNAMLQTDDRTQAGITWGVYGTGNVFRVWKSDVGDRMAVDHYANMSCYADLFVTGSIHLASYLQFQNTATGTGPFILCDSASMVFRLGPANSGFYFQNYAGTANVAYITGAGDFYCSNIRAYANITSGNLYLTPASSYIYMAGATINGPVISADATNIGIQVGSGGGGVYIQGYGGTNRAVFSGSGGGQLSLYGYSGRDALVIYEGTNNAYITLNPEASYQTASMSYYNLTTGFCSWIINGPNVAMDYLTIRGQVIGFSGYKGGLGGAGGPLVYGDSNWIVLKPGSGNLGVMVYDYNANAKVYLYSNGTVLATAAAPGQFRMAANGSGTLYGSMFHNNGTDTYMLLTNLNDAFGSFNGLRPFTVNNATGSVSMSHPVTVYSGITHYNSAVNVGYRCQNVAGNSNLYIFDDGNSHIEGTVALWLNGNTTANVNCGGGFYANAGIAVGAGFTANCPVTVNGTANITSTFTAGGYSYLNGGARVYNGGSDPLEIFAPNSSTYARIRFHVGGVRIWSAGTSNAGEWLLADESAAAVRLAVQTDGVFRFEAAICMPNNNYMWFRDTNAAWRYGLILANDNQFYMSDGSLNIIFRAPNYYFNSGRVWMPGGWSSSGQCYFDGPGPILGNTCVLQAKDTAGNAQWLISLWNDNNIYIGNSDRQIYIRSNYRIHCTNEVWSQGPTAGLMFANRDYGTAAFEWQWYSAGSVARLWSSADGDNLTCDRGGSFYARGNISCGGSLFGWDTHCASGLFVNGLLFTNNGGWWWTGSPIHSDSEMACSAITVGGTYCTNYDGNWFYAAKGLLAGGGGLYSFSNCYASGSISCGGGAITANNGRINSQGGDAGFFFSNRAAPGPNYWGWTCSQGLVRLSWDGTNERMYFNSNGDIYPYTSSTCTCGNYNWWNVVSNNFSPPSDPRLKQDIELAPSVLDRVRAIPAVTYRWRHGVDTKKRQHGWLSTDVRKVMGDDWAGVLHNPDMGVDCLSLNQLTAVLWKALQEMADQADELRSEVRELKEQIKATLH